MPSAADIAAEMDPGLKALFQAGLELSLQLQADAMCADSAEERSKLALSFHRMSRSVRQTAALRMKIAREAERSGREASAEVVRLETVRLAKRRRHVKAEVESLIWSEAEADETEQHLRSELEDLLEIESQDEDTFLGEPAEAQIQRLAHRIGLKISTAHPGEGRDPSGASTSAPVANPSSAWIPAFAGMSGEGERAEDDVGDFDASG